MQREGGRKAGERAIAGGALGESFHCEEKVGRCGENGKEAKGVCWKGRDGFRITKLQLVLYGLWFCTVCYSRKALLSSLNGSQVKEVETETEGKCDGEWDVRRKWERPNESQLLVGSSP
ncbi:hypothetical protein RUM43_011326 [Polyplax serrata]|uniref:Uncharacterized protein n=1 Tax=Polyplax serrata TaxID=468196 RepID=A0AAN8P501_POLSC